MLKAAKEFKPNVIVLIGDYLDCAAISDHSRGVQQLAGFRAELADGLVGLSELNELGAKHKYYIAGNHEDRLRRYLNDHAGELDNIIDIPNLLRLEEQNYLYVPYKSYATIGKVYLTHDVGVAGRYAAYRALDDFEHSVVTGHAHRMCYVVEGNATGERKVSAMFGWLGDSKQASYMHEHKMHDWALGFGVGYHDTKTGIVYMSPIPIVNYTCVVEGKLYSV